MGSIIEELGAALEAAVSDTADERFDAIVSRTVREARRVTVPGLDSEQLAAVRTALEPSRAAVHSELRKRAIERLVAMLVRDDDAAA